MEDVAGWSRSVAPSEAVGDRYPVVVIVLEREQIGGRIAQNKRIVPFWSAKKGRC
jgi:hypothetical protein